MMISLSISGANGVFQEAPNGLTVHRDRLGNYDHMDPPSQGMKEQVSLKFLRPQNEKQQIQAFFTDPTSFFQPSPTSGRARAIRLRWTLSAVDPLRPTRSGVCGLRDLSFAVRMRTSSSQRGGRVDGVGRLVWYPSGSVEVLEVVHRKHRFQANRMVHMLTNV